MIKENIKKIIEQTIVQCRQEGLLQSSAMPAFAVEAPKNKEHGDFATNAAMLLAPAEKKSPRDIAGLLAGKLQEDSAIVERVEIAGPGFINFHLKHAAWCSVLEELEQQGERFGSSAAGSGAKIQVEFVSANPTGPLHVGHGRGAALGDALARILAFAGYAVQREYYINNVGIQMQNLGKSVYLRYLQLLKQEVEFPDGLYKGDYIFDVAKEMIIKHGERFVKSPEQEALPFFTDFAATLILDGIREDLAQFGVGFDHWFSEKTLFEQGAVQRSIDELKARDLAYEHEGALWFRTTRFGDEKDRVMIKEDGNTTYFASDIAYHREKFSRGFDRVIDIWGADHHGYVPRMKGVLQALGIAPEGFSVILVQMVNLLRGGVPVAMSTRSGEFVTLKEVVGEVGSDAARFIFLTRRSDAQLDFDLEVAKKQSDENPVYYVQYGHARICSITSFAREKDIPLPSFHEINPSLLIAAEEIELIKKLAQFPEIVLGSAHAFEPHRISMYLMELVGMFHSYYGKHRIITDNRDLSRARLFLINGIRRVLRNGLTLLGVSAPEKM
jgi:arginyl-tRNA synthetase